MVTYDRVKRTGPSEYKSRGGVKVDTLQVHHQGGTSLATLLNLMMPGGRKVSATFALGTDGTLVSVVPLNMRPFTSASSFDARCYTVETVNTSGAPGWGISDASHRRLGKLLAEMHRELGTKLSYGVGGLIFHRDVPGTYPTACPGPSMDGNKIIAYARQHLGLDAFTPKPSTPKPKPSVPAAVKGLSTLINGSRGAIVGDLQRFLKAVYPAYAGHITVDDWYGPQMVDVVKELQSRAHLTVDGKVGVVETWPYLVQHGFKEGYGRKSKPAAAPKPAKKSVSTIAAEVLDGKWGNGADRKSRLERAGYSYGQVQDAVNARLAGKKSSTKKSVDTIANEVIRGNWGNGAERKRRLEAAGYSYSAVMDAVNRKL